MSGDLSPTTSRDAVKLFEKIGSDLPPGLIQLAGGTNEKTHELLNSNNLPDGIAFRWNSIWKCCTKNHAASY